MEFSYQSNGFVYFAKFDRDPHHTYAKVGHSLLNCKPVITCFVDVLNQIGLNFWIIC